MNSLNYPRSIKTNEQGLVSMIIVVILMVIISIITLSFAAVVRNEQRQALDRQLNTQAYYAAESGINYASKVIKDNSGLPLDVLVKSDCPPDTGYYTDSLVLEDGVTVSCLLVQTSPKSLVYDLDTTRQSKVFPIKPVSNINKIKIEWTPQQGSTTPCPNSMSSAATLPPATAWTCPFAVLRLDLTNTSTGLSRQALAEHTFSTVVMPTTMGLGTAGSVDFANGRNAFSGNGGTAAQGARWPAHCSTSKCEMTINLSSLSSNEFYMRANPIYKNTQLTVTGLNGSTPVALKDAQIVIDATGKAQDILRRVQVRIPLIGDGLHADYGIQSKESVCKRFTAFPGYSNNTCL